MTASLAAPTIETPAAVDGAYQPGVCNIGPMEIARRRMVGHVGVAVTVAVLGILIATDAPPLTRLAAGIPGMVSASGYLQARMRFCAGYAQRGIFNFGEAVDHAHAVADPAARATDRRTARRISLASLAIGVGVGAAAVLLPI
ncbi:MAG TPA: hypothetical protein VFP30_04825 [Candidatus Limnocylindria bacterium]|nr:hypothetical protein [Candidatus Limnocylindria bacterium]